MPVQPADLTDMEQIDTMALGMAESEDLVPAATVSFDYTFTQEDLNAPLELACHVAGHYGGGDATPGHRRELTPAVNIGDAGTGVPESRHTRSCDRDQPSWKSTSAVFKVPPRRPGARCSSQ